MGTIHISPHERLKKYALKDIEQLYNDFHVKEGGLTQEQIEQMRKQHGSNHVGYSGLYAAGNGRQTVVYSEIPYIVVGEGT